MFPAVTRVADDLLVTFSTVPDGWPGGEVRAIRSHDDGATWTDEVVVVSPEPPVDACLSAISTMVTSRGTVLAPYNTVRWTSGGVDGREVQLQLARSLDGGVTWESPRQIAPWFHWPAVYGRLVELGGRLLWPVWGSIESGTRWRSALLESTDDGESWSLLSTIAFDPAARLHGGYVSPDVSGITDDGAPTVDAIDDPGFRPHASVDGFSETTVIATGGPSLLAVLRQQGAFGDQQLTLFRSESADAGRTWSGVEPLPFSGMSPALHRVGGCLLLATRRHAPDGGPEEPGVELRVADLDGRNWSAPITLAGPLQETLTAEYQCGYPAFVDRRDGTVLVVFYSYADGRRYLASSVVAVSGAGAGSPAPG